MRQQELRHYGAFDVVEEPALAERAARPQPAPAVPDMPAAAGVSLIASYAALMLAFVVTIPGARAEFAIAISAFYIAMFFGVPIVFLGIEQDETRRPDLLRFLDEGIDTANGRISGASALVQMLIVPVLLAFAILAMGITYLLV